LKKETTLTEPTQSIVHKDGQNGDINVVKAGGLSVNDVDVATETYVTTITDGLDTSVSQLATASTNHGGRITDIEDAGYVTQSALSVYATASSLGTTNDTVGGINTRVNTLENAGYVTSSGLSGYNFATQGYVATAVDILNNTNIGATATSGTTAGVTVTDKASGTGVDFNFTIPVGAQGIQGIQGIQGATGATGASGSSVLDSNGDLNLSWSGSRRLIMNYDNHYRQGFHFNASTRTLNLFSTMNDSGGAIAFRTRGITGSSDTDYGTERMRIDDEGKVGIGG
jgi:hypothetical protein